MTRTHFCFDTKVGAFVLEQMPAFMAARECVGTATTIDFGKQVRIV